MENAASIEQHAKKPLDTEANNSKTGNTFSKKKFQSKSKRFKKHDQNSKWNDAEHQNSGSSESHDAGFETKSINKGARNNDTNSPSPIEILSVKRSSRFDKRNASDAPKELRTRDDATELAEGPKSKPPSFDEFRAKNRKNSSSDELKTKNRKDSSFNEHKTKSRKDSSFSRRNKDEPVVSEELKQDASKENVDLSFEHKKIPMDLLKSKRKPYEKRKSLSDKPNRKGHFMKEALPETKPDVSSTTKNMNQAEAEPEADNNECNTSKPTFEKERILTDLFSVMSVESSKKEPISSKGLPLGSEIKSDSVSAEKPGNVPESPSNNILSDETHIPMKYRSSTPTSSAGVSLSETPRNNSNAHIHGDKNPKNCPYLNSLQKSNATVPIIKEKMEIQKSNKEIETLEEKNPAVVEEQEKPKPFKSLLGDSGPSDFFTSLLNETLLKEDRAWQPTPLIDISQINSAFEAPKLTENTSTIVMTNAEKEILIHRGEGKHPDDHGGPYVVKLSNLQRGFNSEFLVEKILKPKKILFLRTKMFWEPNFKVSADEMKKICFLELKYFEEIDRCIRLLKNNAYLIKADICSHDDFSKVANLQNMQWGDPEFVDTTNKLLYGLVKYKVNLNGDPIGVLKEGEDSSDSSVKLPSLPTLGNVSASKKTTDTSESIYSRLSSQIMSNKEKSKTDSINNSSVSSSPSAVPSPIAKVTSLGDHHIEKRNSSLSPSSTNIPLSSSHALGSDNSYRGSYSSSNKFTGNKTYNKNRYNSSTHSQFNRYKSSSNSYENISGSTKQSSASPKPSGLFDNKSFGFASGFVKNTGSKR